MRSPDWGGGGIFFRIDQEAAGYGIAQDRNWGWYLGIAVSAIGVLLNLGNLLGLLFAIAQIALLVHPMSRSYTKTWFR